MGFESGLVQSYNLLGTTVHTLIEDIHDVENFWKAKPEDIIQVATQRLDDIWKTQLRGSEEVKCLKKYHDLLDIAYEDSRTQYEKRTGKKSKAPWMTSYFTDNYKEELDRYKTQFNRIAKGLSLDAFEPIEAIFKDSYKFSENYIRLIKQELYRPKELLSEVDFEGEALTKMSMMVDGELYSFRGKIDQVWLMKDGDIYLYDIKSGRKQWSEAGVRNNDQLFLYSRWVLKTYGKLPDKVGIIDVRNGKITEVFVDTEDYERSMLRIKEKLRLYKAIREKELYFPAAGSTDNFCAYCPVGRSNNCKFYKHSD